MINKSLHIDLRIESTLVEKHVNASRGNYLMNRAGTMVKILLRQDNIESIDWKSVKELVKVRCIGTTMDSLKVEKSLCLELVERRVQQ